MKKIMFGLVFMITLAACTNHGKKVKIEGTKAEVYYKGDGVTEDDAKKTGEYLKSIGFLDSEREGSIQLTREGDVYTMRFVYDKKVYDTLKDVENNFKLVAAEASKEVFSGKKVTIALADKHFKDYKTIAFDESFVNKPTDDEPANQRLITAEDYKRKNEGDIDFRWYGISDDEARLISDYIVSNGAFSGGTAQLWISKDNDRYIIRFPMIESARNDPSYHAELDRVTKQIKDNVFPDLPFSFYVTDERQNTVKAWDY